MNITEKEHKKWHRGHPDITQAQHKTLMKAMRVSEEEHKEWHKTHRMPRISNQPGQKVVNPFAVGGGFLIYCVKRWWLIQEGKGRNAKYFATQKGEEELKKFGIKI
jgi:hypothetical protein